MGAWDLAIVASLLLGYAALSRWLSRTVITAPMVFVAAGLAFGADGLDWVDVQRGHSVRVLAEATLTLVLFADASRIDLGALRREVTLPVRLLGIGLPLTIVAGTFAALAVLGTLTWAEALVLAVVLAPTDAALGQAVVTDQRLPVRIRQGLNVESGLNDGICVPLLFIAVALADAEAGGMGAGHALRLVVDEIGWGVVGGAVAGAVGALVLGLAGRHRLIAHHWVQVVPLAAAGLAYGIATPLGGSGFIAAFTGGLVFGVLQPAPGGELTYLVEAGGGVLNAVTFVVFGAVMLPPALNLFDWRIVLYAVLSLTLVRMIPVALALGGLHARRPTVAFLGWFGPRGLASIVFAVIILEGSPLPHDSLVVATILITVLASVYAHGLTAVPLTGAYARWFAARPRPPDMESVDAAEQRWRLPVRLEGTNVR